MLGLKRLTPRCFCLRDSIVASPTTTKLSYLLQSHHLAPVIPKRFFDFYQLGNKAAIEKERARLADEMTRGYFADMTELKQHGGKIAEANKVIIPAMAAMKFPDLEVNLSDGKTMKLPIRLGEDVVNADKSSVLKASLLCVSFRASSQEMINSWSMPFVEAFGKSKNVNLYQISFVDSWLLCRYPIKRFLLWTTKKPSPHESKDTLQRQTVYSFGDHYYFRKELRILNLLTGYIFLLDKFGKIRWQGFGMATKDELSSLLSCTSLLLVE